MVLQPVIINNIEKYIFHNQACVLPKGLKSMQCKSFRTKLLVSVLEDFDKRNLPFGFKGLGMFFFSHRIKQAKFNKQLFRLQNFVFNFCTLSI
jgi:hypothetical protein